MPWAAFCPLSDISPPHQHLHWWSLPSLASTLSDLAVQFQQLPYTMNSFTSVEGDRRRNLGTHLWWQVTKQLYNTYLSRAIPDHCKNQKNNRPFHSIKRTQAKPHHFASDCQKLSFFTYSIHRQVPPAITKDLFTCPWQIIYTSLVCW